MNLPSGALVSGTADGTFSLSSGSENGRSRGFVAGPENAVLLGAIEDFCASPETLYNPLVLHGPPGIGKTHLARIIAERHHATGATDEGAGDGGEIFTTGSDWATGYADAVESRTLSAWRERNRSARLLVIDGLEALAGKHAAQIELLHTCDELLHTGQKIVVTARREPGHSRGLLPGLASRLMAGLVVEIVAPGEATRRLAIEKFAHDRQLVIDAAAIDLLAAELAVTVPELSGALHELRTLARDTMTSPGSIDRISIDRAAVRALLQRRRGQRDMTLRNIAGKTARHFGVPLAELRGPSRRQNIAKARGVAMHLARQLTGKSLEAVGGYFGGRDHTTVMYACRKTDELIASDATIRSAVAELRSALVES